GDGQVLVGGLAHAGRPTPAGPVGGQSRSDNGECQPEGQAHDHSPNPASQERQRPECCHGNRVLPLLLRSLTLPARPTVPAPPRPAVPARGAAPASWPPPGNCSCLFTPPPGRGFAPGPETQPADSSAPSYFRVQATWAPGTASGDFWR